MNKDIKFQYYSGNIKLTRPLGYVTLDQFINANKNPSEITLALLDKVKQASLNKDLKLKRELKHGLYSFTPSILINPYGSRSYDSVVMWTGLMQIDFDGFDNITEAKLLKQHIFDNNKEIILSLISPSGLGVKCIMKTTEPKDKEQYKALHKAMVNKFEEYGNLDEATKNAMLPLFLSADKDILYRDIDDCDTWTEEDHSIIEYVQLKENTNFNTRNDFSNQQAKYFYNKVVRITKTKIESINNNGHPQLRSVALILGSRVGANYIDESDARNLLLHLIENNSYFNKGLKGYIATAIWALDQGINSPRYFN